jgi:Sec-independent protein translocase protein TatA
LLSRRRKYAAILVLAIFAILLWFSKRMGNFVYYIFGAVANFQSQQSHIGTEDHLGSAVDQNL